MQRDSDWLWRDGDVLRQRQRKAAAVIAAVAEVLSDTARTGISAGPFVSAYQRYQQFSIATRDILAAEPYAYYWGRLAYELLQLSLRPEQPPFGLAAYFCERRALAPRSALEQHLPEFTRLLLAAAYLDNKDLMLERPLRAATPLAVPGLPITFDGPGEIVIKGVQGGEFVAHSAGAPAQPAAATQYPVSQYHNCRVRLQPAVFNVLASGISQEFAHFAHNLQTTNRERIEAALSLLHEVDNNTFDQIATTLRVIATRPAGQAGEITNVSHCDLPGAIMIYAYPHPHELANIILHEFLHNRLFALEEEAHFLAPDKAVSSMYSPWRDDYRPAHGLLHAAFVFTGIGRFWRKVIDHDSTPQPIRELAKARLLHSLFQVRIGLAQLRHYASFTEAGNTLMQLLDAEHQALWDVAREMGIQQDYPVFRFVVGDTLGTEKLDYTIRDSVSHHVRNYARSEHVDNLDRLISSST